MDDHSFDKFIKGKLDGYEDPAYDPSALAGFRSRLAFARPAAWYDSQFSHYLIAASLTLFTVLNLYIFWPGMENSSLSTTFQKGADQKTIDSLNNVIAQLNKQRPAITAIVDSSVNSSLINEVTRSQVNNSQTPKMKGSMLFLGPVKKLSPDVYHALVVRRMLVLDGEDAYMAVPRQESIATRRSPAGYTDLTIADIYSDQRIAIAPFEWKGQPVLENVTVVQTKKTNQLSSKQRTALEKHYFKGIGINIAPHLDGISSKFSSAEGSIAPRLGVVAEWVVSPRLSVETGVDYTKLSMDFDKNVGNIQLPSSETNLGDLERVKINTTLVSAPVAVKYRQWISEKVQGFIKVGYTPYFSLNQEYQCGYDLPYNNNPMGGYGPVPPHYTVHRVNSVQENNDRQFYGGTSTVSVGLAKVLPNKNKLEASLLYEKSLAPVGTENQNLELFGLRAAYWFNLR